MSYRATKPLSCAMLLVGLGSIAVSRPAVADASEAASVRLLSQVREWRREQGWRVLQEFVQLLSLPNVASNSVDIRRNAEAIRQLMEDRAITTELWTLPDGAPPVVYGQLRHPGATRTFGVYAHYDGQPVDESQWAQPAWSPVLYSRALEEGGSPLALPVAGEEIDPEWRLYGR
jgi:acetylornithine deacetylase/succinyl-diaminopimelate desuccinylase-like protein